MIVERLLIAAAVFLVVAALVALWKRPSRKLSHASRLDLRDLGIEGPAIVQFTTRFCAPCKAARPKLIAHAGEADVAYEQIDLEERPDVMHRYGIRTAPTIVVAGAEGEILGRWTKLPANGEILEAAMRARVSA